MADRKNAETVFSTVSLEDFERQFVPELAGFFREQCLHLVSVLPLDDCRIINPSLLARRVPNDTPLSSALLLAVPYFVGDYSRRNISLYAVGQDYHLYFRQLFSELLPLLQRLFPGESFFSFSDHSPIDERSAAVKCGFGVYGDNGLLITHRYGSYVFLGEILSTLSPAAFLKDGKLPPKTEAQGCLHCGLCQKNCPMKRGELEDCLSFLTQQKGELSEKTKASMIAHSTAWGCDLCQIVCPLNQKAEKTPIPFFRENLTPFLTSELIGNMSEDTFSARAYAWKKRATILRNLAVLAGEEEAAESRLQ